MKGGEVTHDHAADHDVVEMGDDKISILDMNVDGHGCEEKAGESSDCKKADETERVEHGGGKRDRGFVERGGPIEDFDGPGNCNQVGENRKSHRSENRLACDKHVVAPGQE